MDLSAKMARQIGLLYLRFLPWIFVEKCGNMWEGRITRSLRRMPPRR